MIGRRLIAIFLNMYPGSWRNRYGEELAATLEQIPAVRWSTLWDLAKGAIAMQFRYHGSYLMRTAAICVVVGLMLASVGSFAIRDLYASETLVGSALTPDALRPAVQNVLMKSRLQAIIEKEGLYKRQSPEKAIETLKNNISISAADRGRINGGQTFRVVFVYPDAAVSQRVIIDLSEMFIKERDRFNLLDGPRLIDGPIYPNRGVISLIGLLGGTLLGCLWAFVRVRPV
jgi:hypothetical protein